MGSCGHGLPTGPIPRPFDPCALGCVRAVFSSWVRGLPIFFDPGYFGRPLWPANFSRPVGPLPCLARSRRFIGGPLTLLVEVSVSLQSWQAIGFLFHRLFVFWADLALPARSCFLYSFR